MQVGDLPVKHRKETSVFHEIEEDDEFSQGEQEVPDGVGGEGEMSSVKRLAKAYEDRSTLNDSASGVGLPETELERGQRRIEPQWTGSSSSSTVWQKWGIKRQHTGSTSISSTASEHPHQHQMPQCPVSPTAQPSASSTAIPDSTSDPSIFSPPPPYLTPIIPSTEAPVALPRLSPEPEDPSFGQLATLSHDSVQEHVRDQLESYKTLRRDHLPTPCAAENEGYDLALGSRSVTDDEEGDSALGGTIRRVTLRPGRTTLSASIDPYGGSAPDTDFGRVVPARQSKSVGDLADIYRRLDSLERRFAARDSDLIRGRRTDRSLPLVPDSMVETFWEVLERIIPGEVGDLVGSPGIFFFAGIGVGVIAGGLLSRRR